MKLNRNNYEEYFILYLDNELDSEGRREVEAFVKQNPDLKGELDMLMQSKLTPDAEISFAEKGSLMRFDSSSISLSNYEEWLTSYIDDELTEGERRDVEVFVAGNPAIQRELNLLQQTKLQPETIVFPNKESLYRREEKARVISVKWWRIAAAAVLILGVSTTAIVLLNNKKTSGPDAASSPGQEKKSTIDGNKQPTTELPVSQEVATSLNEPKEKEKDANEQRGNSVAIKPGNNKSVKKNEPVETIAKEEKNLFARDEKKLDNNLPASTNGNPNLNRPVDSNKAVAIVPKSDPTVNGSSLTNNIEKIELAKVTDETPQPSYAVESSNKGIRGFLRKVTRTIEKRTNIKATDDDDRLLVAGLAIKL